MKMLELYCGTKSVSKAFERIGWEIYTVDWNPDFNPSLCADISTLTYDDIIALCKGEPNVIWVSPDCTTYSISAISTHRDYADGLYLPKSEYARFCDKANRHVADLLKRFPNAYVFIENPRGVMRKMDFWKYPRYTVTYCQYGDIRQKPTDIWTNHPDPAFKPMCKPGDKCHQSAPRGAKTGTQGLGKVDKSRIPTALCNHIAIICLEKK
jgi:site-specific DNA-cytosine methylase